MKQKFDWNDKKVKKQIHRLLRAGIQLMFFIVFPSIFTAAFAGVRYLAVQIGQTEPLELTAFVKVLCGLCLFTMIFGRFFCGFACAFGSFGDALHALYQNICKKLKIKSVKLPESICQLVPVLKYLLLGGILVLCFTGNEGRMKGSSPWEVFSLLRMGRFSMQQKAAGVVLLILIVIGMCVKERFFCQFLCPMGAVFSLLPVLPFFSLRRNGESCITGCSGCSRNCPSATELPEQGSLATSGDCFMCQKCIEICPKGNIHSDFSKIRGNAIWFTIVRTILLMLLIWYVNR